MLIAGVDEAGRGPCVGPMVLAIACIEKKNEQTLSEIGVKDSKRINSPTFVLIKEYNAKVPLYHLDLYRLDGLRDMENLAIEE